MPLQRFELLAVFQTDQEIVGDRFPNRHGRFGLGRRRLPVEIQVTDGENFQESLPYKLVGPGTNGGGK